VTGNKIAFSPLASGTFRTTNLHLVLRSRMRGAISPLPIAPSWRGARFKNKGTGTVSLLPYISHADPPKLCLILLSCCSVKQEAVCHSGSEPSSPLEASSPGGSVGTQSSRSTGKSETHYAVLVCVWTAVLQTFFKLRGKLCQTGGGSQKVCCACRQNTATVGRNSHSSVMATLFPSTVKTQLILSSSSGHEFRSINDLSAS
jgi:hypothetical protein